MRVFLFAAMLLSSTAAYAIDPSLLREGEMLRDANNVRLGPIQDVDAHGMVGVIVDSNYVQIPATTIKVVDGKAMTSMTETQITGQ